MSRYGLYFVVAVYSLYINGKILIFTYAYNRPDFIEIQHRTLEKFLKDDYEFVVFNDARNQSMVRAIESMCTRCHIRCIKIPQEIHNQPYLQRWPGENYNAPAVRNCNVVQYSLDTVGFDHEDILVLLDSDLFLVKSFSIREWMQGYSIGGLAQGRAPNIHYLWIGLVFLDMARLPNKSTLNFNCGRVDNMPVDAGGHTHYYLENNPDVKVNWLNSCHTGSFRCHRCKRFDDAICRHNGDRLKQAGLDANQIRLFQSIHNVELMLDNRFFHYRGGTNWIGQSAVYHDRKTASLRVYLDAILKQ